MHNIWATSHDGVLCHFVPEHEVDWQTFQCPDIWSIRGLTPHPKEGVYVALQNVEGKHGLGIVQSIDTRLHFIKQGGLDVRAVDCLKVDAHGILWMGNAWGLHACDNGRQVTSHELQIQGTPLQVRALELAIGEGLWIGSNHGLYRCFPSRNMEPVQEANWPRDEVFSLALDQSNGTLWAATMRGIGCVIDNTWHDVQDNPKGQTYTLCATIHHDIIADCPVPGGISFDDTVQAAGSQGLFTVGIDLCKETITPASEDFLSNAVQCLFIDSDNLWMGTARGLFRFDGVTWHRYEQNRAELRDVRGLIPGRITGQIWVGSWHGGVTYLKHGVHIPGQAVPGPIVAMTTGLKETGWAATLDSVYCCAGEHQKWQPIAHPAREHLRGRIIQVLCHQMIAEPDRNPVSTLWVGTSAGLLRYRPELEIWDWAPDELEKAPIQALAVDSVTNNLWVGTPQGLFSLIEHKSLLHREGNILSLTFSPEPESYLWVGTSFGLEQWPSPGQGGCFAGQPVAHFTNVHSGLAADNVTALACRSIDGMREIWVGSTAGVSCYRY
jgi:ligand-binding sensor domain-containing protein